MEWRSAGLSWTGGAPGLRWAGGRTSPLVYGQPVAFRAVGLRRCVGAREHPCPYGAVVPGHTSRARCGECARLDRVGSVAADGVPDDPRTYRVYLAWFGTGLVKVGITAEERGGARLLEQGAVAYAWLGRGPLMAARRTEEVLRAALGVPDRIPYGKKRAARGALPGRPERAAEVESAWRAAAGLAGWPETLERVGFQVVDHAEAFGLRALDGDRAVHDVVELVPDGVVAGELVAAAGPDLYLAAADGGLLVVDTRLLVGWQLVGADAAGPVSVPVRVVGPGRAGEQEGLF
ncbi:DUF2797 domain-containing protein [Streptomyces sp. NPDC004111]|uniref:DUF2797 domain-containing protein n=1 Tax=Streptomyces sp. NPDC004111 TaxID=3364690 RepID=UPI0036C7AE28